MTGICSPQSLVPCRILCPLAPPAPDCSSCLACYSHMDRAKELKLNLLKCDTFCFYKKKTIPFTSVWFLFSFTAFHRISHDSLDISFLYILTHYVVWAVTFIIHQIFFLVISLTYIIVCKQVKVVNGTLFSYLFHLAIPGTLQISINVC